MKSIIKFLDYEIVNTGNNDEFVLLKPSTSYNNLWECHLGNFHDLNDAKKYAIQNFMVKRPEIFHAHIIARMNKTQIYMEWFTFKRILEKENITMPDEINHTQDSNFCLTFNDEVI